MSIRTALKNGLLQSDIDFAGFKPINADLSDYIHDRDPGVSIEATPNLLKGDGLGAAVNSGISAANVVQKNAAFPTPTNLNQVIACLQAAGLCA